MTMTGRKPRWNEQTIKKVYDNFIKDNDRLPTRHEMYVVYKTVFPRPASIKRVTGLTVYNYLRKHYPKYFNRCNCQKYSYRTKEQWADVFRKQYIKLGYPTREQYDVLRDKRTPLTQTLYNILELSTWNELLDYCGVPHKKPSQLKVVMNFPDDLESLRRWVAKLDYINNNIISKHKQ